MPAYGEAEYWDQRYGREPTCFDWYLTYDALEPLLRRYFRHSDRILQLGVGTSQVQADMVTRGGFTRVLNVDISPVAIAHMKALHQGLSQLTYRIADARSMPQYRDGSFDAILDKGTLDSLLCGERAVDNVAAMLDECYRLLRPGGVFLSITYGQPHTRVPLLQRLDWHVCFHVLTKPDAPGAGGGSGVAATAAAAALPLLGSPMVGPIDPHEQASLDAYSSVEDAYFCYIARRRAAGEPDTADAAVAIEHAQAPTQAPAQQQEPAAQPAGE